ncbi:hypothetical protein Y032_0017g3402 [Ancylostoma ceylanicum]|uniref:Uncharacterized protein n=1 Tax=Ancylostoma ceylanicum TaxID=53326 RepID=A0A016V512_9BILA|nr:hypothetical protein Y032_0017g3402 [Ancylostoma ceylanicum]
MDGCTGDVYATALLANSEGLSVSGRTATHPTSQAAQRMRWQRLQETDEERDRRLRAIRERARWRRAHETPEQRSKRLQADRERQKRARQQESREERAARLQKVMERQRAKRAQETIIERMERLHSETQQQRARRATESDEQRRIRLQKDRERKSGLRKHGKDEEDAVMVIAQAEEFAELCSTIGVGQLPEEDEQRNSKSALSSCSSTWGEGVSSLDGWSSDEERLFPAHNRFTPGFAPLAAFTHPRFPRNISRRIQASISTMENVSLVNLGRQVLYDRSLKSMEDALNYFKSEGQKFGHANLDELRKKHMECSSDDLKYMIELIVGSETLAAQRYQNVLDINKDVSNMMGKMKRGTIRKSFFGMDTPKRQFTFHGQTPFKTVSINELYEKWRMSINVNDSEDHKLRRFIRHIMSEVVVEPSDVFRLTTRTRNNHDNLLMLPQEFRATLKGFVLHVCGEDDPTSDLSVTVDSMLTSVAKEIRRHPRKRGAPSDRSHPGSCYGGGMEGMPIVFVNAFEDAEGHSTEQSSESVRIRMDEEDSKSSNGKDSIPLLG